jgi:hypothetical protein
MAALDKTGGYIESVLLQGMRRAESFLPEAPDQVAAELHGRFLVPSGESEPVQIVEQDLEISEQLVWEPCAESLSPLYPLRRVTLASSFYHYRGGRILPRLSGNIHGV